MFKKCLYVAGIMVGFVMPHYTENALAAASVSAQEQPQQAIIQNGDFSQWINGALKGWNTEKGAVYEVEKLLSFSPTQSLKMFPASPEAKVPNAKIFQDVTMNPNSDYNISLALAQKDTGTIAIRIQPVKDGKFLPGEKAPLDWSEWNW